MRLSLDHKVIGLQEKREGEKKGGGKNVRIHLGLLADGGMPFFCDIQSWHVNEKKGGSSPYTATPKVVSARTSCVPDSCMVGVSDRSVKGKKKRKKRRGEHLPGLHLVCRRCVVTGAAPLHGWGGKKKKRKREELGRPL